MGTFVPGVWIILSNRVSGELAREFVQDCPVRDFIEDVDGTTVLENDAIQLAEAGTEARRRVALIKMAATLIIQDGDSISFEEGESEQ